MGSLYFFTPLQTFFQGLRLLKSLKCLMQRLFLKCLYKKPAFITGILILHYVIALPLYYESGYGQ